MRTVPIAWTELETARERSVALLFHIWIARDAWNNGATAGKVTPPVGWGSWCYSSGFQGNVQFTDAANYAQDWQSANGGNPITRTYEPAAIEFDASQVFRKEDTSLDPHDITLTVDPALEPFADYVNRSWPLKFGITIYKVHRAGPSSIATVLDDETPPNTITPADVLFVGYLNADDTLELNSAGLELTINPGTGGDGARAKMATSWDHITKVLDRLVPRPVFSIDCPKQVYGTGQGAAVDCNADMPSMLTTGTVLQMNGIVISAVEWGALPNVWFAQGMVVYTATDPVSGLDFTFTLDVNASAQRTSDGVTWGDLWLSMIPPLLTTGTVVRAYGGCDRSRGTCMARFVPAGTQPAPAGTFVPGSLRITLQLLATALGNNTQNPKAAHVCINGAPVALTIESSPVTIPAGSVWIVYGRSNANQVGNIYVGPGTGNPWDPSWVEQGSSIITTPPFSLASAVPALVAPPAQDGYHIILSNDQAPASIEQQPNAKNDYVTIIRCPGGSPGTFDFTIAWVANTGTAVALGNLENFGGTDIPIEHPSLETAS
ncbi:MAG TPA: hypothetical protein VMV72_18600 [Verrucomicrobiae bacterium]|nr:hypothetical protein [Verrucomicrobiae bacterium]